MRGQRRNDPGDRAIGELAERQHGVVARRQLFELGLGSRAIEHRVEVGRLRPVYRGVYTVGHRLLTQHGRWMAGVLACGPGAVLSHLAAAALWGIRRGTRVEVTATGAKRARRGIVIHRAALPPDEITVHDGIPTTIVPRTLLDLGAVVQRHELRSALRRAEQLRLTDPLSRFQAFLLDAAVPLPATNVRIEELEVDCAWEDQRLIAELDGRAWHDASEAFEADRARDRRLEAAGWRVIRITVAAAPRHPRGARGRPAPPARAQPASRTAKSPDSSPVQAGLSVGSVQIPAAASKAPGGCGGPVATRSTATRPRACRCPRCRPARRRPAAGRPGRTGAGSGT